MLTFEEIFDEITKDKRWTQKALIGGLMAFLPLIHIFAFGFLFRFAKSTLATRAIKLPEWDWNDWKEILKDGLIFHIPLIVYGVLPIILGFLFSRLIEEASFHLLSWVTIEYVPLSLGILLAPGLFVAALCPFLKDRNDFRSLLNVKSYLKTVLSNWKKILIPTLVLTAVLIIGSPLYGFSIFLGFLVMVPYFILVFNKEKKSTKPQK